MASFETCQSAWSAHYRGEAALASSAAQVECPNGKVVACDACGHSNPGYFCLVDAHPSRTETSCGTFRGRSEGARLLPPR